MATTIASGAVAFGGLTGATVQGIQYYESGAIRVGSTGAASLTDTNKHLDTLTLILGFAGSSITVTRCALNIRSSGTSDFGTNSLTPANCTISIIDSLVQSATRLIMRGTGDVATIQNSVLSMPGYALYAPGTILQNSIFQDMSGGATGGLGIRATFTTPPSGCRIKDSGNGVNLLGAFGGTLQGFSFSNVTYEYYIQGAGSNVFTADLNADDIVGNWTFFWEASTVLTGRVVRRNTYNLRVIDDANANKSGVAIRIADSAGTVVYSGNTDASGQIPTQKLVRNIYTKSGTTASSATVNTSRLPYSLRKRIYGFLFVDDDAFTFAEAVNQESKLAVDPNITQTTKSTVLAYTGFTFDGLLNPTLSADRSNAQIYDRYIAELTNNLALAAGNVNYSKVANRIIVNTTTLTISAALSPGGTIAFGGGTLDLTTTSTQSRIVEIASTSIVTVPDGALDLSAWTFASGAQINLRPGATAATITVGAGQDANITEGAGVTLVTPTLAVSISGLIAGTRLTIFEDGEVTGPEVAVTISGTYLWEGTASTDYDIYAVLPGQLPIYLPYTYPSESATLPLTQEEDPNYDPDSEPLDFALTATGLGTTTDGWFNTSTRRLQLATGNNLSQPSGVTGQRLYSQWVDFRYATDALMPFRQIFVAINFDSGELQMRQGWEMADSTTLNLIRGVGLSYYSTTGTLTAQWMGVIGQGDLSNPAVVTYYVQDSATNATITNAINPGLPNQLVAIYGDSTHGDFDLRSFFALYVRDFGAVGTRAVGSGPFKGIRYLFPLNLTANSVLSITDTEIDSNSDGVADVAPFDGMSMTWLTSGTTSDWVNATAYDPFDYVESGGLFYITPEGGTSSGTSVADDTGVDWYEIDSILDANGATTQQMISFIFWLQRQNVDVDAGPGNRTGKLLPPNATIEGTNLLLRPGLWAVDFAPSATLTHFPRDLQGNRYEYPAPPNQIVVSGLPTVGDPVLAVINLTTEEITYPTITSGGATILLDEETDYLLAADAKGYLRQAVTLPGNTPTFTFELEDFRALYESGTSRMSDIDFDYSTYEVTIADGTANLSFADVFRTIEDYLATEQGVLFPNPPYPVVVDVGGGNGRNYLFFPYDTDLDQTNPVRILPDPTNTSDPTLTDFVIVLEGADAPLFDIFDFTGAGGRTIRFQTEAVSALVNVSGGLSPEDRAVIDAIATDASDLADTLESAGVFSEAALANAPAGGGGGGGDATAANQALILDAIAELPTNAEFEARTLPAADYFVVGDYTAPTNLTAQQVWEYATRSLTDKLGFALTADERTAIATAVEVAIINEGDPQQVIDAFLQVINAQFDLPAAEQQAIAQAVRTELATELARIDATISSRLTGEDYTPPANDAIAAILEDTSTTLPAQIAALPAPLDATATQSAAAAALTAYDPPTAAELTAAVGAVTVAGYATGQSPATLVNLSGLSTLTSGDIATALSDYTVPTLAQVEAAGMQEGDRADLVAARLAAEAVAVGDHAIDYAASTATQYDAAGNAIAVFDLTDEDDSPATSAATAVKRVRRT